MRLDPDSSSLLPKLEALHRQEAEAAAGFRTLVFRQRVPHIEFLSKDWEISLCSIISCLLS